MCVVAIVTFQHCNTQCKSSHLAHSAEQAQMGTYKEFNVTFAVHLSQFRLS